MTTREIVRDSLIRYARKDARRQRHQIVVKTAEGYRSYAREKGPHLVPSTMAQAFARALS